MSPRMATSMGVGLQYTKTNAEPDWVRLQSGLDHLLFTLFCWAFCLFLLFVVLVVLISVLQESCVCSLYRLFKKEKHGSHSLRWVFICCDHNGSSCLRFQNPRAFFLLSFNHQTNTWNTWKSYFVDIDLASFAHPGCCYAHCCCCCGAQSNRMVVMRCDRCPN